MSNTNNKEIEKSKCCGAPKLNEKVGDGIYRKIDSCSKCHKPFESVEKCTCIEHENFGEMTKIVNGCPIHDELTPKDNLNTPSSEKRIGGAEFHMFGQDYERNYSHSHCWNQGKSPACGQPLEKHKQCCLCDTLAQSKQEEKCTHEGIPKYRIYCDCGENISSWNCPPYGKKKCLGCLALTKYGHSKDCPKFEYAVTSPQPSNWETTLKEKIEEEVETIYEMIQMVGYNSKKEFIAVTLPNLHINIFHYIKSLLLQAQTEERQRLVEKIEGMKESGQSEKCKNEIPHLRAYNKALDDLIRSINNI